MKTVSIVRRIIAQILNDKRSLALILVVPVFLITLIYFLLGQSDYKAVVAHSELPASIVENIEMQDVTISSLSVDDG